MRHFVLCGFLLLFAVSAAAQSSPRSTSDSAPQSPSQPSSSSQDSAQNEPPQPPGPGPVEVAPYEISAGYNLRVFTLPNYARIGLSGGYGLFEYKILSRLSAAVEVSAAFRNQGVDGNLSIYHALFGPQIYPFKHRRKLTPFAHLLFGEAFYRNSYPPYGGFPAHVTTDSSFSWEGGAGLDLTRSTRWAVRLIEVDYASTKFLGNSSQNNYRVSIGFVYHFGLK